jgi:hypothetical protein
MLGDIYITSSQISDFLENYIDNNLASLSNEMRYKLGKATGKALASNLTITFNSDE